MPNAYWQPASAARHDTSMSTTAPTLTSEPSRSTRHSRRPWADAVWVVMIAAAVLLAMLSAPVEAAVLY
jgi:hypothetical protein